jgi:hypothetical protein
LSNFSSSRLSLFLQYIPKFELERVINKVKMNAAVESQGSRCGMWNNFCVTTSALDDEKSCDAKHVRMMTDDEVHSVLRLNENEFVAPLFGPPRRFSECFL